MSDERDLQRKDRRSYRLAGPSNRSFSSTVDAIGHIDDLVPGYALGALEDDEVAAVDAHIRGCRSCERSLADAQRTTGMLPFMVPMQKPPIDSKVALFARVAHAQRAATASSLPLPGVEAWRTPTIPSAGLAYAGAVESSSTPASAVSSSRASRSGWFVSVLSVPLLIALVATGFWGLQLQNQLSSQSSELAELQSELANFGSGTTSYPLSPGHDAPQAEGQIVMGSDGRAGMLQIDVNSKDVAGAYELWVNQDGQLVPAAEFTVNQDGQGQARFELDQPFGEYESVHIRAKAIDAGGSAPPADTLVRDSEGALGSTGSGLDLLGP
ncbi:MAG TPA: zf-HC2 domain-containing protein [Thermomicrobiales bacterium]|nr:zf-HC2 domain-containing protein [Thermomicrobiales bacterium]